MEHGLIKGVEIRLVKFDESLYNKIIETRNILSEDDRAVVREALRYNVFSITAFSDISGIPKSTITSKMRPSLDASGEIYTELDYTYLFSGLHNNGFKFIVRNEKSEGILRR